MNHCIKCSLLLFFFFINVPAAADVKTAPSKSSVALTFDDGPDPRYTLRILEILSQHKIKATFFVLGQSAKSHPELVKAILNGGHVVANHTYTHANLKNMSRDKIASEIQKTNEVIKEITGQYPKCLRPPYGALNKLVREVATQAGVKVVTWDLNSFDYTGKSPEQLTKWVLSQAKAGSDILMHDSGRGGDRTSRALPDIIEGYEKQNIGFEVLCE